MEIKLSERCLNPRPGDFQALQDALYVIGGKWRMQILYSICRGKNRFREIERNIPGITTRMLSKELKVMEVNGLIDRNVYPSTPVSVEYTPNVYTASLCDVIEAMIDWGIQHREKIKSST